MFIFCTCQPGVEKSLLEEIKIYHPDFRLAYSRPGFLTLKTDQHLNENFELKSAFALSYGVSVGKTNAGSLLERVKETFAIAAEKKVDCVVLTEREGKINESVFESKNGYEPPSFLEEIAKEFEGYIKKSDLPLSVVISPKKINLNQKVLNLVLVEPEEWWFGIAQWNSSHRFYPWLVPGGKFSEFKPAPFSFGVQKVPSRAYFKTREVLLLSELPIKKDETALELGAAPGGGSLALLEQGLYVYGVDPAEMSVLIDAHERFTHLHLKANQVSDKDLDKTVDWFFSDMNVPPEEVLRDMGKLLKLKALAPLKGGAFTVKLESFNQTAEIPRTVLAVQKLGFKNVRVRHLYSNRTELTLWFWKDAVV